MSGTRIRKNDTVIAMAGVSRGKTGKVLHVFPKTGRAIVEGLNVVKKSLRKTQDNPQGGIADKESAIQMSNLMPYCPTCKKGVRVARLKEGDNAVRKCRKCGHAFDG